MCAHDEKSETTEALAIKEVALTRDSAQAAKIRIIVDGKVRNVARVEFQESRKHQISLLYDPHHNLEERIINEQFTA